MAASLTNSIIDLLLGSTFARAEQRPDNRASIEGLSWGATEDGAFEIRIQRLDAASLRLASGPHVLEVGTLVLDKLVATVRLEGHRLRLSTLHADSAELSDVTIHGPLACPPRAQGQHSSLPSAPASWFFGPLETAEGTIRAEIVDAHLMFDADVTVPIQRGLIEFKDATVEHVGPDSRMGVSHLGLYVDAPNGRSYLYQFASPPEAGVVFEKRGALLGPWGSNRGSVQLQPFTEWLLRQPLRGQLMGVTEQARSLFDRTAVSGVLQLGDARFTAPHVQAEFTGRADGCNAARLDSQAVGRGLAAQLAALSLRNATLDFRGMQLQAAQVVGALTVGVLVEDAVLRYSCSLASLKVLGIRVHPQQPHAQS